MVYLKNRTSIEKSEFSFLYGIGWREDSSHSEGWWGLKEPKYGWFCLSYSVWGVVFRCCPVYLTQTNFGMGKGGIGVMLDGVGLMLGSVASSPPAPLNPPQSPLLDTSGAAVTRGGTRAQVSVPPRDKMILGDPLPASPFSPLHEAAAYFRGRRRAASSQPCV